jgi:hypothetical protein
MQGRESTANNSSELSARYSDQCRIFEERNTILVMDNERLEDLQFYMMSSVLAGTSLRQQQEGVLMHYNELQSRSAEVETMASNFQKMVADEVAKAGLRAKPDPKKKGGTKGTTGRGKPKHSELNAQENSATKSLNPMAPPRSRKKDKEDSFSTATEL